MPHTTRLHTFQLALVASMALGLGACSKTGSDAPPPTAMASSPGSAAAVLAPAPVPAPVATAPAPVVTAAAPAPVVVARNNSSYEQGRRDQQRQDAARRERAEQPLPPRADRDADIAPAGDVDRQRQRHERQVAAAACRECGVVESITAVKVQGRTNGVGAVAGGVGGALVGNRIAGRDNRALGGVVGAVGGGLLGNAIEKHQRTTTVYDVTVRMSDGRLRTVRESTSPVVGEKVRVEADGLHDRS
jgi:outer membrane lipoprotein SlyB